MNALKPPSFFATEKFGFMSVIPAAAKGQLHILHSKSNLRNKDARMWILVTRSY